MIDNYIRDCCQTPIYAIHDQRCPIIVGPHARSHISTTSEGNRHITTTVYCMCGSGFTADDERDARAAHTHHAVDLTNSDGPLNNTGPAYCTDQLHTSVTVTEGDYDRCGECGLWIGPDDPRSAQPDPIGPAASPPADIYDATTPPGVTQLPAVTTGMTPAQFREWLAADGTLYMVILPANRTFVIKVPGAHHEFFVAMMQQVRFALGPEVQAVRMNMVTGPPADVDAATGKADDAPQWAQPAPGEHLPESLTREARYEPAPPEKHEYISRPAAEQEQPDGLTTRCPRGGICPSDCSRTPDGCQNVERCAHGVRMGIGRYCADCDTSPVKYGPGAAK